MRSIAILGATGSIGTQALSVVRHAPELFSVDCLAAYSSAAKLFELVREFKPRFAALEVEPDEIPADLKFCEWVFGRDSAARALDMSRSDYALCAIVGVAGLNVVWTALDVSKRVLLANKEALVTGGRLVMEKAKRLNKPLLPVDSEHSAIYQCLRARDNNPVKRLILTCSGGALRDMPKDKIETASVADVLKHPTWRMGKKITVDCASMVNKGLEVMEASCLFDMPPERISVIIHPESIIHSMIEFEDNALLAQLNLPDMRQPISYAMGYPDRIPYGGEALDLAKIGRLTFSDPDADRFPCLNMAYEALAAGDSALIAYNGANEEAVSAFLAGRILFGGIPKIIGETLEKTKIHNIDTIESVYALDEGARNIAKALIGRFE